MDNPVLDCIFGRRSIRSYKNALVTDGEVRKIIEAAAAAPSSMNRQPWHFSVIQDRVFLDWIVKRNREIVTASPDLAKINGWINVPNYDNFYGAPTAVLVAGDSANPWHDCDCALAAENMSLAAWSLGVGSCIIASARFIFDEAGFLDRMKLPEGYKPLYFLTLGYINGDVPPAPERKALDNSFIR